LQSLVQLKPKVVGAVVVMAEVEVTQAQVVMQARVMLQQHTKVLLLQQHTKVLLAAAGFRSGAVTVLPLLVTKIKTKIVNNGCPLMILVV
jgi:hypothetical protein